MYFEMTMRLMFGQRADQIAGQSSSAAARRSWLNRSLRVLRKLAVEIDTTPSHTDAISRDLEKLQEFMKRKNDPDWHIVYAMMRLIFRLFGFNSGYGVRCHTPIYWRTQGQYYSEIVARGGDPLQKYYDNKGVIETRKEIIVSLRERGLDDFMIALILNQSENMVKTLRRSR